MANIWVLVADNSAAKLLETDYPRSPLHEIKDFTHSASRLRNNELVSDSPGRTFDRKGYASHGVGSSNEPKKVEAEVFARELVHYLDSHRNNGHHFKKLVLVAPPKFLGLLRSSMSEHLRNLVVAQVSKNMVKESSQKIQGELPYSF